jgi:hypothetical protein
VPPAAPDEPRAGTGPRDEQPEAGERGDGERAAAPTEDPAPASQPPAVSPPAGTAPIAAGGLLAAKEVRRRTGRHRKSSERHGSTRHGSDRQRRRATARRRTGGRAAREVASSEPVERDRRRGEDSGRGRIGRKLGELSAVAVKTAERFSFPLSLAFFVVLFIAVQGRIDRRDPKLRLAPLDSKHDVASFA